MKAYLFIKTGEVKNPTTDDWYINMYGNFCKNEFGTNGARTILTRHEIEIPGEAVRIKSWCSINDRHEIKVSDVPIPLPKKKVKRWWWNFEDDNAADGFSTSGPYTEEEVKADYPNAKWYHRIDETMIEVEE